MTLKQTMTGLSPSLSLSCRSDDVLTPAQPSVPPVDQTTKDKGPAANSIRAEVGVTGVPPVTWHILVPGPDQEGRCFRTRGGVGEGTVTGPIPGRSLTDPSLASSWLDLLDPEDGQGAWR